MPIIFNVQPIKTRKGVPFYWDKKESDFKVDKYENYDEVVQWKAEIHLAPLSKSLYVYQRIFDVILAFVDNLDPKTIVDLGCGLGTLSAAISYQFPKSEITAVDTSYQMLKMANDYWRLEKKISIDNSKKGFEPKIIEKRKPLENVNFILAKCEETPFIRNSVDLIVGHFLLDRLKDPKLWFRECHRILRKNGNLIFTSPFNFNSKVNWEKYFPPDKLLGVLEDEGFSIINISEKLFVSELIDAAQNMITYNTYIIHCRKN